MTTERCPHCRAKVGVTPHRKGGWRCKLCRGPRVVLQRTDVTLSGRELPHLLASGRHGRAAWVWAGGSVLLGLFGMFFLLVVTGTLLFFRPESTIALVALLGLASLPLMMAFWAWRKGGQAREQARAELHEAHLSAARDVLNGTGRALTVQEMAGYLQLSAAPTERLLAELNVDDSVMSDVTEAGEVTYRMAPLRARIDEAYARSLAEELDREELTPSHRDSEAHEAARRRGSLNKH